jgi:UDP-galactopyranose mutase
MVGEEIYKKFFYGYTKKQYMREPKELPTSIIQRLPIRLTYDENYFTTKFQGIPKNGYTNLIYNMLDGIDVEVGIDFIKQKDKTNKTRRRRQQTPQTEWITHGKQKYYEDTDDEYDKDIE